MIISCPHIFGSHPAWSDRSRSCGPCLADRLDAMEKRLDETERRLAMALERIDELSRSTGAAVKGGI